MQAATTIIAEYLWDMSSKEDDISQSGFHGCGLKKAALYLLSINAKLKMWMPGASVEDEFLGDSWEFKLNNVNLMKVHGSKLKEVQGMQLSNCSHGHSTTMANRSIQIPAFPPRIFE